MQLICTFVFAHGKSRFSHGIAHMQQPNCDRAAGQPVKPFSVIRAFVFLCQDSLMYLDSDIQFLSQTILCLFTILPILYNTSFVYCRELAPGTFSLSGDWARGD